MDQPPFCCYKGILAVPRDCVNFHIKMLDSAYWGLLSITECYMKWKPRW